MKIAIEIHDPSGCAPDPRLIDRTVSETLGLAGFKLSSRRLVSVSLAFVLPAEIRRLNRTYREYDKVTDILSFSNYPSRRAASSAKEKEIGLGELVLCCAYIRKSAKMHKVSETREMAYVLSHGILHLLGWRHGRPMFAVQDRVLEALAVK